MCIRDSSTLTNSSFSCVPSRLWLFLVFRFVSARLWLFLVFRFVSARLWCFLVFCLVAALFLCVLCFFSSRFVFLLVGVSSRVGAVSYATLPLPATAVAVAAS